MASKQLESGVPSNIQAEATILGSILVDNDVYFDQIGDLSVDDFSLDSHKIIFRCFGDILFGLIQGAHSVDIVTAANELKSRRQLETVGGVAYLTGLTEGMPRRPQVEEYVRIVREKAKLRVLMALGKELHVAAVDESESSAWLLDWMQERLTAVVADEQEEAVKVGDVCGVVERSILKKREAPMANVALELTWGVNEIDKVTKGIFKGELTIVGGDSGGGKTAAVLQAVVENALMGIPGAIFSMEMSKEKLIQRMYPLLSEIITSSHTRDPRLMNLHTHVPEMQRLSALMASLPIWIDDTSPLSLNKFKARAKRLKRRHGVQLVAADYLQLFEAHGNTDTERTRNAVFALRDFAKENQDMALLVLSQYSKDQGFTKKRRRTKGDLYGGSAIHHAAQNIVLITIEDPEKRDPKDKLDAEIMIDKSRDGGKARATCFFDRDHLKFVSKPQGDMRANEQFTGNAYGKDRSGN